MFGLKKIAALALAVGLAVASQASAATVALVDGGTVNPVATADTYVYDEILEGAGGAGSRSFSFVVNASDAPLPMTAAAAHLRLTGNLVGAFLSWFDGTTTTTVMLDPIIYYGMPLMWTGALQTLFTSPDKLAQTVSIGWTSYRGPVQLSLSVAAVPLPAGGLLLIGAMGGLAALRRRKTA